jgi:hypothetical protein
MPHGVSPLDVDLAAVEECLTDGEIDLVCTQLGHTWRQRVFTPGLTVRSVVYRGLHPDKSIAAVLADLAARCGGLDAPTDAAWCQARDRLPQAVLPILVERTADRVVRRYGGPYRHWGRPVCRFDGSSLSMPDEPALVEHFGHANTKHGLSRFPVARVGLLVGAGTEVVLAYRMDPYTTDERTQFRALWPRLPCNAICVCDRKFCNFYDLAKLRRRGVDVITRLHQRRAPHQLIAAGRQVGPNEWHVPLELADQLRRQYADPSLPQRLWVRLVRLGHRRGRRRKGLWLVTTLMDPQRYPRRQVLELYRDRWTIETRIGELKTTLAAKVLRSQTVDGVRKELAGRVLAYNLVWTVIHQAAERTGTPAQRIGFADTIRVILAFSLLLRQACGPARRVLHERMLDYVAIHRNPCRPGRTEPRLIKRDRRRYGFLKEPRDKARLRA